MLKKTILLFLYAVISFGFWIEKAVGQSLIPETACFEDTNGNGTLDAGEFADCASTPQGYLCLLDHTACLISENAALCPTVSSLNTATDQCEYQIQYRCTSTGSVFQTSEACSDSCDPSTDCETFCPDGMTIDGGICVASPTCSIGNYNQDTNTCIREACPYGDEYACKEMDGNKYCSALSCVSSGDNIIEQGSSEGSGDIEDNGPKSVENLCLGNIYIFSGRDRRCRSWGATIAFDNCCLSEDYLLGLVECNESEKNLASLKEDGLCHYVGEYCSKEIDLLFTKVCVERKGSYCCFNSKLARIVQEQGRAQLSTFSGWGSAANPNCRGFTPEEFQVLDFSKIDLSEWHGDIETTPQTEIENNLKQGIMDFYETIRN